MATHVKILGWLYLAFGAFGLFGALAVLLAGAGGGMLAAMDNPMAGLIVGGASVFAAVVVVIFVLPSLLTGWGLLTRKPWARMLAIIVGIISLINIPLGTILGVYTLWVMFQDEVKYQFNG